MGKGQKRYNVMMSKGKANNCRGFHPGKLAFLHRGKKGIKRVD